MEVIPDAKIGLMLTRIEAAVSAEIVKQWTKRCYYLPGIPFVSVAEHGKPCEFPDVDPNDQAYILHVAIPNRKPIVGTMSTKTANHVADIFVTGEDACPNLQILVRSILAQLEADQLDIQPPFGSLKLPWHKRTENDLH